MTRLAKVPRTKLTQADKTALIDVATRYEQAQGVFQDAADELKKADKPDGYNARKYAYKLQASANRMRARAVWDLMEWARKALTEDKIGVGFPYGTAHPRLTKAFDSAWDCRRWGSAGCAREAAKTIRNIVKRGWI